MNPIQDALETVRATLGPEEGLPEPEFLAPEEEIEAAFADARRRCREAFRRRIPVAVRMALDSINRGGATLAAMREVWKPEPGYSPAACLIGVPGSGKTVAACYAAMRMIGTFSQPASFIGVDKFALSIGMGADSPDWDYVEDCHRWAGDRGRIIVLDDLGRERASDAVTLRIRQLLRAMYERHARVIVTTNFGVSDILDRYGDDVSSRFVDTQWITLIPCPARDLRGES